MSNNRGSGVRARERTPRRETQPRRAEHAYGPAGLGAPAQADRKAVTVGLLGSAALVLPAAVALASQGPAAPAAAHLSARAASPPKATLTAAVTSGSTATVTSWSTATPPVQTLPNQPVTPRGSEAPPAGQQGGSSGATQTAPPDGGVTTPASAQGWTPHTQWPPQLNHEGGWQGDGGQGGGTTTTGKETGGGSTGSGDGQLPWDNGWDRSTTAPHPQPAFPQPWDWSGSGQGQQHRHPYTPETTRDSAGTTAAAATTGTTSSAQAAANPVPVFNSMGTRVGTAVQDPTTGTVQLLGPTGIVLGTIQQRDGTVDLIGAGGAVLGNFALNSANQVTLTAPGTAGSTATGTTTTSATTTMGGTPGATTGAGAATGATGGTAVPVFDAGGIQIGLATTNPATGAPELIGFSGNILGVIAQQDNAVNLLGQGNAVLGSFTVNPAGQVLYMPAASRAAGAATGTSSATGAGTAAAPSV